MKPPRRRISDTLSAYEDPVDGVMTFGVGDEQRIHWLTINEAEDLFDCVGRFLAAWGNERRITCPHCNAEIPVTPDDHGEAEIEHMKEKHADIIAKRMISAGFGFYGSHQMP